MKISCSTKVRYNNRLKKFHSKTITFDASCLSTFKPCNFIKGRLQHRCFPVSIAKFLRKSFFTEDILFYFFWLLLAILYKLPTSAYKVMTPWTQDVNWTSYVRSIYVLCPGGGIEYCFFKMLNGVHRLRIIIFPCWKIIEEAITNIDILHHSLRKIP